MKNHLSVAVCLVCYSGTTSAVGVASEKNETVSVSCSAKKGDCWAALSKAVSANPTKSRFDVQSVRDTGGSKAGSITVPTSIKSKWFYNKMSGVVDHAVIYYAPEIWGTVGTRTRYSGVSSRFLKQLSLKTSPLNDAGFDALALRQGIQIKVIRKDIFARTR